MPWIDTTETNPNDGRPWRARVYRPEVGEDGCCTVQWLEPCGPPPEPEKPRSYDSADLMDADGLNATEREVLRRSIHRALRNTT